MDIPFVTRIQMKEIDSYATKHFGIEVVMLMENAGRSVAELSRQILGKLTGKRIVVLAGKGNNGGDSLAAARFLINWGSRVVVVTTHNPESMSQPSRYQAGILRSMFANTIYPVDYIKMETAAKKPDLIIDGLLGYNIEGEPRGNYALLINYANTAGSKILSIDLPSGSNPDGGSYNPCIKPDFTLALGLPKLFCKSRNCGRLYVCDIGIPNEVYELMQMKVDKLFAEKSILYLKSHV